MPGLENDIPPVVCAVCDEEPSDCDCWECSSCNRRYEDGEGGKCSNCEECENCCTCAWCSACEERFNEDDQCSTCSKCSECCDCTKCERCSCRARADNSNDIYICSNCERCECCCCSSCSSCNGCGDRFESTCSNCERCSDCCECVTCRGCRELASEWECDACERCEDCGCNCSNEGEAWVPASQEVLTATVTQNLPQHDRSVRCERCARYACNCRICWTHEDGAVPAVAHVYASMYGSQTCNDCHTCRDHCRAEFTCPSCPAERRHHEVCNNCTNCLQGHCGCFKCTNCMKGFELAAYCLNCYNCTPHCVCPKCPKCGDKSRGGACNWCNHCRKCCAADDSECSWMAVKTDEEHGNSDSDNPLPTDWDKKPTFHIPANLLGYRKNTSRRVVGIELETNGYPTGGLGRLRRVWNAMKKWGIAAKEDGSIGDFPEGIEFNLAPAAGDLMVQQVTELCEGLQFAGASPTKKCGIHVHVDCRDVRADDLKRIIDVYVKVERALFNLCHPERLNSDYTLVCGSNYKSYGKTGREVRLKLTEEFFETGKIKRAAGKNKGRLKHKYLKEYGSDYVNNRNEGNFTGRRVTRYRALNLVSFFIRRTVEFRHFHSSIDPVEVSNWAAVCAHVVDAAIKLSHRQVEGLPNNSRKALLAILPPHLHEWVSAQWMRWDALVNTNGYYQSKRQELMNGVWRTV